MKNRAIFLFVFLLLSLSACRKQFTPDLHQVEAQILADKIITDAFVQSINYATNISTKQLDYYNNAKLTTSYSKKLNCFITDLFYITKSTKGKIRRYGEVIFKWNKGWKLGLNNSKLEIEFKNYKFNDVMVRGKIVVRFVGFSEQQNPKFELLVNDLKLIFPDQTSFNVTYPELNVTFKNGFYSLSTDDDILSLSYKSFGINRKGKHFDAVGYNLIYDYTKKIFLPVSGAEIITVSGDKQTINYGDGIADNKLIITQASQSEQFIWKF